ncbi:protein-tyrosine phosphatase [Bacillus mesophilus]|uniref:Tyrosine-protein phosphatase n=1 Tax=Bacillus mesophilus TaxID=1808955 RepID=A0A6M0Q7U6_9BACI|nr:CpsB/CapC family capsule biosynthesis tyrosine phosphatase [Bacillus mesophilus]MBM7661735.1 protein-tyrosine phosphatase [Bacillus mesophilus]NEY72394.1 tyrosine protein phosphatase [Bacillus mesophilus]
MIDIHCHILSGLDDGPKDITQSLHMAKIAVAEGITKIVATPHFNQHYENEKKTIVQDVHRLNDALQENKIPLQILPGQEPRIYGEILEDYEQEKILTINDSGKYLFIELPSNHVPAYTESLLFDIQMKEITPIIVHPERNQQIIENPDILYNLVKKGALSQVTASSITGDLGKKIKKFSLQLVENQLTHFIASDAHNDTSRPFRLRAAYGAVQKEFGLDTVYLFQENAEILVEGNNVYKEEPQRIKSKKFFGIF